MKAILEAENPKAFMDAVDIYLKTYARPPQEVFGVNRSTTMTRGNTKFTVTQNTGSLTIRQAKGNTP